MYNVDIQNKMPDILLLFLLNSIQCHHTVKSLFNVTSFLYLKWFREQKLKVF